MNSTLKMTIAEFTAKLANSFLNRCSSPIFRIAAQTAVMLFLKIRRTTPTAVVVGQQKFTRTTTTALCPKEVTVHASFAIYAPYLKLRS